MTERSAGTPKKPRFGRTGRGASLKGFRAALRLDRILKRWPEHWKVLESQGYAVDEQAGGRSIAEVRRFLARWSERMRPAYMAVSFPIRSSDPDATVGRPAAQ